MRRATVRVADRVQADAYEAIDRAETAFSNGPALPFATLQSFDPFAFMPGTVREASETAARTMSDALNVARRSSRTAGGSVEDTYEVTADMMTRGRERSLGLARAQVNAGHELVRAMVSATTPTAFLDAQTRFAASQAKAVSEAAAETVADMRNLLQR